MPRSLQRFKPTHPTTTKTFIIKLQKTSDVPTNATDTRVIRSEPSNAEDASGFLSH